MISLQRTHRVFHEQGFYQSRLVLYQSRFLTQMIDIVWDMETSDPDDFLKV